MNVEDLREMLSTRADEVTAAPSPAPLRDIHSKVAGVRRRRIATSVAAVTVCGLAVLVGLPMTDITSSNGLDPAQTVRHSNGPSPRSAPGRTLPVGCSKKEPCQFGAETYEVSAESNIPGLQLTLPAGWVSEQSDAGQLNLSPPGHSDENLFFSVDLVAVKGTGQHKGTVLPNVGTSPQALVTWLTGNPDFHVVSTPEQVTVGHGIAMTSLTLNVSRSANYDDADCPSNPRCAAVFGYPKVWGHGFYAIGGPEEVQLLLTTIRTAGSALLPNAVDGTKRTMIIGLDAPNHIRLQHLQDAAQPILDSLSLPTGS